MTKLFICVGVAAYVFFLVIVLAFIGSEALQHPGPAIGGLLVVMTFAAFQARNRRRR
jgi:hypothetical protein